MRTVEYGIRQQKRRLGFETYVAPTGFDRHAQPVDIYDVFKKYYRRDRTAKFIYSLEDSWGAYPNESYPAFGANEHLLADNYYYEGGTTTHIYSYELGGVRYTSVYKPTNFVIPLTAGDYHTLTVLDTSGFPDATFANPQKVGWYSGYYSETFTYTRKDATHFYSEDIDGNPVIQTLTESGGWGVGYVIQSVGTKKYVIVCNTLTSMSGAWVPAGYGHIWLYCGNLTNYIVTSGKASAGQSTIKYIHIDKLDNITIYSYASQSTWLTGNLYLSRNPLCTYIGPNAPGWEPYGASFSSCTLLTGTLTIPSNIKTIQPSSFAGCGFDHIVFEEGLEKILNSAFSYMPNLTGDLIFPETLTFIGEYAFYNEPNVNGELYIPEACYSIGEACFMRCNFSSMTTDSATVIKDDDVLYDIYTAGSIIAIYGRKANIGTLTIRNDCTKIGDYAFIENNRTGNLEIPNTVVTIDLGAFQSTQTLTGTLTFEATSVCSTIGNATFYNTRFTGTLTIPASVRTIDTYGFAYNYGLTELLFEEGITSIGVYAFYGLNGISGKSLTIPNSVITINTAAFSQTLGTVFTGTLTLGSSVQVIGSSAFSSCYFTGTLTIPASVIEIGEAAFMYSNFSNISSSATGFVVDDYVLYDEKTLGQVKANISARTYSGSITIRSTCTSVLYACFWNNTNRTGNLLIPNSVTEIRAAAFNYFNSGGTLTFGTGLLIIGENAFSNATFTNPLTIPDSVITMNAYAFYASSFGTGTLTVGSGLSTLTYASLYYVGNVNRIDCLKTSAPTIGVGVIPFSNYNKPLHIKSGATGYDVAPWTDTAIFSSITADL